MFCYRQGAPLRAAGVKIRKERGSPRQELYVRREGEHDFSVESDQMAAILSFEAPDTGLVGLREAGRDVR